MSNHWSIHDRAQLRPPYRSTCQRQMSLSIRNTRVMLPKCGSCGSLPGGKNTRATLVACHLLSTSPRPSVLLYRPPLRLSRYCMYRSMAINNLCQLIKHVSSLLYLPHPRVWCPRKSSKLYFVNIELPRPCSIS